MKALQQRYPLFFFIFTHRTPKCNFIINLLNVTVICDSLTDKWMWQSLALKVIHGSIAISPGKLAWTELFWFVLCLLFPPPQSLCVHASANIHFFLNGWISLRQLPKVPSVKLMFPQNNSFVVNNPVFVIYGTQVGGLWIIDFLCVWLSLCYLTKIGLPSLRTEKWELLLLMRCSLASKAH